ncbi:protein CCSMST1-like [Hoplias malabaricus]|uniref:protein CCSMST1-like n=1 Tax=Hoplias malabaricus TaxID=27720 RepID=UPI0034618C47
MASAVRMIFTVFPRFSTISAPSGQAWIRTHPVRALSLTSRFWAKSQRSPGDGEEDEVLSKPIKFSTSKGSHRTWKVERSMGSTHQKPWWRVLPLSLLGISFILWCFFRRESEVDQALEKQLYEHLPDLLTIMEEEEEEEEEEGQQHTEAPKKDP